MEECGELTQIAAKKLAYIQSDIHPDGKGCMNRRLEEELADVIAIAYFVERKFKLDCNFIEDRISKKLNMFLQWDAEE